MRTLFLCLIMVLRALPAMASSESSWLVSLRYCDLVVRGEVVSAERTIEKVRDVVPLANPVNPETMTAVTKVRLRVEEVIWGDPAVATKTVDFIAIPTGAQNYWVGQETIIGLVWSDDILGGRFWVYSDRGRFVLDEKGWRSQEGGEAIEGPSEVKNAFAHLAPRRLVGDADVIVKGVVANVHRDTIAGPDGSIAHVLAVDLDHVVVIAGEDIQADRISAIQITSGSYWPNWRDSAPLRYGFDVGRTFCLLLKRVGGTYAILKGINGAWEVRGGESLYFAGRVSTGMTMKDLQTMKEQSK